MLLGDRLKMEIFRFQTNFKVLLISINYVLYIDIE